MLSLNFGPTSGMNSFCVSDFEPPREEGALIIYPSFMPVLRRRVGLFLLRRAALRSASHVSFGELEEKEGKVAALHTHHLCGFRT